MIVLQFSDGGSIQGETPEEVLDAWNAEPWWAAYAPAEFRAALVRLTGAELEGGLPAADDEILPAVIEADPNVKLVDGGSTITSLAKRLTRRR